jgi:hypothetical protein
MFAVKEFKQAFYRVITRCFRYGKQWMRKSNSAALHVELLDMMTAVNEAVKEKHTNHIDDRHTGQQNLNHTLMNNHCLTPVQRINGGQASFPHHCFT